MTALSGNDAAVHPKLNMHRRLLERTVLLALLAGLVWYLLRVTQWFSAVPGDLADGRFNSVILEHLYQWVNGDAPSLWSPRFFYPIGNALAFSDNHFGSGLIYVLLRILGLGREQAFNGWYILGCLSNFAAMYWVARRLSFSMTAASVAAFIYTLPLPATLFEGHAQLVYRFAVPLAWLALIHWLESGSTRDLVKVAAWSAWQFYCAIYLGVFLGYLLVATIVAALLQHWASPTKSRRSFNSRPPPTHWWLAALVIAICVAAIGSLLLKYHAVSREYGFVRPADEVMSMVPHLRSYLLADRVGLYAWIGFSMPAITMRHEHQMFLGLAALLLAAWGLWAAGQRASSRRWLCCNLFLTLFLLIFGTLQVHGVSPYQLIMKLPGVSSIRAVSRIILIMTLPVAVLAAAGIDDLLRRRTAPVSITLTVCLLLLENLSYHPYSTPIAQWEMRLAQLDNHIRTQVLGADAVIYVSGRVNDPFPLPDLDAMIFAQNHRLATLNGYSGNVPPGYIGPTPCIAPSALLNSYSHEMLAKYGWSPAALLTKTIWLSLEDCPAGWPATDAADSPPTAAEASQLRLSAAVTSTKPAQLDMVVHLYNGSAATLHTRSRRGYPLRVSWRFVPIEGTSGSRDPKWDTRLDLHLSIPAGMQAHIPVTITPPVSTGVYDLQFSLVAESYAWLHDLGMPISHTRIAVDDNSSAKN